jgi:putative transcriptional regulator
MPIAFAITIGLLVLLFASPLAQNVISRDHSTFSSSRTCSSFISLESHHSVGELSKGKFLVSSRQIGDPRFMETVLLLIQHDSYGTVGLIINRPTQLKLSDIFPDIKGQLKEEHFTYIGGPVAMTNIQFLIHPRSNPEESQWVFDDVYVSSSKTVLDDLIKNPNGNVKFRIYAGYAGWISGQLEQEVLRGDWHVMQADAETIFDKAPSEIWPDLIRASELIRINNYRGNSFETTQKTHMGGT